MLILAHLTLHRLLDRGVPPGKMSAVMRTLDAASLALCQGQFLDLRFEERLDVTVEEYLAMVEDKT
ncbi:MAG: polyprenyl synthetase family protein, partial [Dehalococcoidia bacterium]